TMRAPAAIALLVQIAAACITFAAATATGALAEWQPTVGVAALFQGGVALMLARWRAMAPWWLAIHFLFPIALLSALALGLPPGVFLGAFFLMLLLFWSTFRTQVPFYPSGRAVWKAVEAQLPDGPVRFVDIGSGLGGMVLHLAQRRQGEFIGVEIAPLPWLVARTRAAVSGSSARFRRADYETLDLGAFDVVFAYLSPAAMPALWRKAHTEMRQGALLFSLEFPVPGVPAHEVLDPGEGAPALYLWRF
ncbi:class I SAM-dependent methyltransferase, partial [Oxalobacteraceae bacterium OM1]